jgi:hypothetical protein
MGSDAAVGRPKDLAALLRETRPVRLTDDLHPLAALVPRYQNDHPGKTIHPLTPEGEPDFRITRRYNLDNDDPDMMYLVDASGAVELDILFRILPKSLQDRLLDDKSLTIPLGSGSMASYEKHQQKIRTLPADEALLAIGRHVWREYLPNEWETEQKEAVKAISRDDGTMELLPPEKVPLAHKSYAKFVGALEKARIPCDEQKRDYARIVEEIGLRLVDDPSFPSHLNRLEEHFARNISNLVLRKPLEVLPTIPPAQRIPALRQRYDELRMRRRPWLPQKRSCSWQNGTGAWARRRTSPTCSCSSTTKASLTTSRCLPRSGWRATR